MEIPGVQEMEFRAVWADVDETRTSLQPDGTSIWWSPGDQINVFYGGLFSGQFTSTNAEAQPLVNFRGSLVAQTGTADSSVAGQSYWAVYPYYVYNSCDGESVEMTLPTYQEAVSGTFSEGSFPAVAKSEGLDLAFFNVCGGARFSVANEGVRRVVFRANAGESLGGEVRVAFGNDGKPFIKEVLQGVDSVVVEGPSGGFVPGEYYYVAILPQTLSRGLQMVFRKEQESASLVMNNSISVNRSRFGMLDRKDQSLAFTPGGGVGPRPWYEEAPSDLVTVHNPSRGGLEDVLLDWGDYEKIKSLKVIGTMNDVDFLVIYRDMPNLRYLDISDIDNTSLPAKAFNNSENVTHLILPEPLTIIFGSQFKNSSLSAIKIQKNVATIASSAFEDCKSLTSVIFEKGSQLKTISGTFYGCSSLTSIEIPASVETIGERSFYNCGALETVTFERGSQLKTIQGSAFRLCSSLRSIVFPASVETIGVDAFYGCDALETIAFERKSRLKEFTSAFSFCWALTSVEIPVGVKTISPSAFRYCSSLRSIEIPASVETIGSWAFQECSLTSIEIPASVETIGGSTFENCKSLETVTFERGSQLKTIQGSAFRLCSSLTSIEIPASVETIGDRAFDGCGSLETVTFEKGSQLKTIQERAFADCSALTTIEVPASVETMGKQSFQKSISLETVTFEKDSQLKIIQEQTFSECSALKAIEIPKSIETISDYAFQNCTSLDFVTFEEESQLKSLSGFSNCPSLTEIIIPKNVQAIKLQAFQNCTSLLSVRFEEGARLNTIAGQGGVGAFSRCSALTAIRIPKRVQTISAYAFDKCTALSSVSFEEGSLLMSLSGFSNCQSLTEITIPKSVEVIESQAFQNCTSLLSVHFEEQSRLKRIAGEYKMGAFFGCSALAEIKIPSGVVTIGLSAFENCVALAAIEIPSSVQTIQYGAFRGCSSLSTVIFEEGSLLKTIEGVFRGENVSGAGTKNVGIGAFSGCTSLTTVVIPASVETIGMAAFANCTSLSSITFEEEAQLKVLSVAGEGISRRNESGAFFGCIALKSIIVPPRITDLSGLTFSGCSSLAKITFKEGSLLEKISDRWNECSGLKTFDAKNCTKLGRISESAFSSCSNLKLFYFGAIKPPTISSGTFRGIDPYAVLKVPDESVGAYFEDKYWGRAFSQISGFSE